jgi:hypothetical protein
MKTVAVFWILACLALPGVAQQMPDPGAENGLHPAKDVRIVNGKEVDLGPLHEWLTKRAGPRPLSHWKKLQILEIKGNTGGYQRCIVKTESDAKTELLIANLPPEPGVFFQSLTQQYAAILRLRQQVAADQRAVEAYGDRYISTPSEYTSVTSGTGGTAVDSETSRRAQYRAAVNKRDQDEKALAALELRYQESVQSNAARTSVLAMFTGQSYAKLEIWDCGRKK